MAAKKSSSSKKAPPKKAPAKKAKAKAQKGKARFSVQELAAISKALKADPATKGLANRVINALHDPGVTVPPAKAPTGDDPPPNP